MTAIVNGECRMLNAEAVNGECGMTKQNRVRHLAFGIRS
jgi:hypothetical protein